MVLSQLDEMASDVDIRMSTINGIKVLTHNPLVARFPPGDNHLAHGTPVLTFFFGEPQTKNEGGGDPTIIREYADHNSLLLA